MKDGHPILVVTATDIARILRVNSITSEDIDEYLSSIDSKRKEWNKISKESKLRRETTWKQQKLKNN